MEDYSMKKCIFCGKDKKDNEYNAEHIILKSIGGKGENNYIYNVCIDCNSTLGTKIDSVFLDLHCIQAIRWKYKIPGHKNKIPNPTKGLEVTLPFLNIKGELVSNQRGDFTSFQAKHDVAIHDNITLITCPHKGDIGYISSQLRNQGTPLSNDEINRRIIRFKSLNLTPKLEYLDFSSKDIIHNYLYYSIPAIYKMCYEYCYKIIGERYLDDIIAKDICMFINCFDKTQTTIIAPSQLTIEWKNKSQKLSLANINSKISIKLFTSNNTVKTIMNICDIIEAQLVMSSYNTQYRNINKSELIIDLNSKHL